MDNNLKKNSFDELYEKYSKLIYSICYHILLSKEEAKEAVQEVFLRLNENIDKVVEPKYWLVTVANNYCKDQYNRKKRHGKYMIKTLNRVRTLFKTMTSAVVFDEEVQKLFSLLSNKERTLLTLRFGYDYSYEEIGQILEMPLGTVKSSISRLLAKIKG